MGYSREKKGELMARTARVRCESRIYHVIIRGINKQDIFLDSIDKRKFLKELEKNKNTYKYDIFAYCLMDNHVHLLLKDNEEKLDKIMQSITISYVSYFNKKYDRVGHLFQNRFISKCINDEKYLLTVQKYIHQNPQIAGIEKANKYMWSSYREYMLKPKLCTTDFILKVLEGYEGKSFAEYTLDISNYNAKIYNELEGKNKLNDSDAIIVIKEELCLDDFSNILNLSKKDRNNVILKIKKIGIFSNTQIARILGINRKLVDRV